MLVQARGKPRFLLPSLPHFIHPGLSDPPLIYMVRNYTASVNSSGVLIALFIINNNTDNNVTSSDTYLVHDFGYAL